MGLYQVEQRVGEGPSGVVFQAARREPGDLVVSTLPSARDAGLDTRYDPVGAGILKVALKLIKKGPDWRRVLARFEAERDAISGLDHPNIARWIDAGTRPSGQPYFVSEWVDGPSLIRYCDDQKLSLQDRLELLIPVCQAVQQAHRKGLVHGGLKPSNMRVANQDDKPVAKVLDFAAAVAMRGEPAEGSDALGRAEYLSPGRANRDHPDVETGDDVYSLGVLLYELLTGTTPIPRERLRGVATSEALRLVREAEAPLPSARVEELKDDLALIASKRRKTPESLVRALRGELDCVAMKAIAKDRERRYETAADLARDLRRYLAREPLEVCPPGPVRRAWTTARTHPLAATAVAGALLLMLAAAVAGSGLAAWEYRGKTKTMVVEREADAKRVQAEQAEAELKGRLHQAEAARKAATRERDQALAAADVADRSKAELVAVLDFLKTRMLSAGRPGDVSLPEAFWAGGKGKDVTLLQAAEKAAALVAEVFADRPLAEADVREILGLTYLNVGVPDKAVPQYERAVALREALQGDGEAATAACRNLLAIAYRLSGRPDDASRLFEHHPDSATHAASLAIRGATLLLEGKPAEAELKLRESLMILRKVQPDDWRTFDTESMLGEALLGQKKYDAAEPLLLSGYEGMKRRKERISLADQPRLIRSLERLVTLYESWGKTDAAMRWRKQLEAPPTS